MGAVITLFISVLTLAVSAYVERRAIAAAAIIGGFILIGGITDGLTSRQDCGEVSFSDDAGSFTQFEGCDYLTGDYAPYIGLLSPSGATENINNAVFDVDVTPEFGPDEAAPSVVAASELSRPWHIAAYLVWVLVPAAVLWNRYRRIRL